MVRQNRKSGDLTEAPLVAVVTVSTVSVTGLSLRTLRDVSDKL